MFGELDGYVCEGGGLTVERADPVLAAEGWLRTRRGPEDDCYGVGFFVGERSRLAVLRLKGLLLGDPGFEGGPVHPRHRRRGWC